MHWLLLIAAGLCEVGFTTFMKLSDGFSKPWPTAGFVVFCAASFWLLNLATKGIPLGTAYAVWTGIGAAGTALVGMVFFQDPTTTGRLVFLTLLIGSVIGLKLVSK